MSKFKKNNEEIRRDPRQIPKITGANFEDGLYHDIAYYDNIIKSATKPEKPIRVLLSSEAAYLNTGFSVYARNLIDHLSKNPNIELAHIASYGAPPQYDSRAKDLAQKCKYYHVLPENQLEEQEYQKDYQNNQFGKWKGSYVFADFKPDIVIDMRDWWMVRWILEHPFKKNFHTMILGCVDSYPQKWQWLKDYNQVDTMLSYSFFGKRTLETQSRLPHSKAFAIQPITVKDICPVGVNTKVFKPLNKEEVKKIFNIDPHYRFVGTVMRNQPRKLFPRIIESFKILKQKYQQESQDVMLLLHTSMPDVGWDLPTEVFNAGLNDSVIYSYICSSCGNIGLVSFQGKDAPCPICGKNSFSTPNTQVGFNDEQLNLVFNLMDIYIQGSIAEGCGSPINEAKSAGVPVLCSDYSAMYEKARNGGALPILNETLYTESETGQYRSLFDREDLAYKMAKLLRNNALREKMSKEGRECAEKYYSWDLICKKWEAAILTTKLKDRKQTWEKPIEIKSPIMESAPSGLTDEEFVIWAYKNILMRNGVDKSGMVTWLQYLKQGATRDQLEQHFRGIITKENNEKRLLSSNSMALSTSPVDRVRAEILKIEGSL